MLKILLALTIIVWVSEAKSFSETTETNVNVLLGKKWFPVEKCEDTGSTPHLRQNPEQRWR